MVGLQKTGQVVDHVHLIDRFVPASRLFAINDEYRYKYILAGREASKNGLLRTGKDPKGLAASVIYMAAKAGNCRKTQAEVSEVAKVTEVTLRSRSKQIKSKLH